MIASNKIRPLLGSDASRVCGWLEAWLLEHIGGWTPYYGLTWDVDEIAAHIARHALVDREWAEIVRAAGEENCLVRVMEEAHEVVGIIYAEFTEDRYLKVPVGVVSWLYVDPVWRGAGIASRLIGAARTWHAERGAAASEVFVTMNNFRAMHSYIGAGFAPVDARLVASLEPHEERIVQEID